MWCSIFWDAPVHKGLHEPPALRKSARDTQVSPTTGKEYSKSSWPPYTPGVSETAASQTVLQSLRANFLTFSKCTWSLTRRNFTSAEILPRGPVVQSKIMS